MKKVSCVALLLMASFLTFAQGKSGTFSGEIMDKQCAQMGSHENSLQQHNARMTDLTNGLIRAWKR
jgi:hypothetical protein